MIPSMRELKSVPLPRPLTLMLPEVNDVVAVVVLVLELVVVTGLPPSRENLAGS